MKKIGVFGGTFNPIHSEHIVIARLAIEKLNLDKLFIMPTFISPHKKGNIASAEDRFNMLKLAFKKDDKIEVSDFEIKNGGESFTYITVEHFRSVYPDAQIFLICGADMLNDFKRWKYPERILNACSLCAFGREDYQILEKEHKYFKKTFNKDFTLLNYKGKNVSSTRIRVYSALGLSVDGMTDDSVIEYIKNNNLYKGNKYFEYVKSVLPEKRLRHTAEVVIKASSKIRELSLDSEKVYTACVLHDIAKYQKIEDYPCFTLPKNVPEPVVHAFLGAYISEKVLGITDMEIIDAIKYHTSGKANMTTLGKLLFTADMVDETRNYEGVEKLREYFSFSLEKGFIECLKEEMLHLKNKNQPIYVETINAYNYYVKGEKE
ncbi:MAG: nicotinate (nicotinamide) nucleotide adenylyltransferase [Firmicutes bacterium]|nr:nicotinate (nicotinamide) nucleotide adenylyltransferase [Candidatus Caballimonas caccae]